MFKAIRSLYIDKEDQNKHYKQLKKDLKEMITEETGQTTFKGTFKHEKYKYKEPIQVQGIEVKYATEIIYEEGE